ncbi:hypothetical protein [Bacillus cereus]|jgi:hypothetical protein|uniref:hypothetical protein n=1 Tax=Bacillus cereus TaxID=1396 RepID=UPI00077A1D9C|nr:hypothetical protein [Bacillus cereus]KXY95192.1 hypothetical protein AT279_21990 [Bacillus cereus]MCD1206005.1 hypothetical protein [Bacillus cereus]MCU5047564.1 hypothetical protein [Bacillus cereus]MCU5651875.1 hypothetical protein [Bacillus cereus]WMW41397.1 hypothetical protein RE433_29115 [Bacillus cereus]
MHVKEMIGAVLLFFMERYLIEPFVEYIEQKTRNLSIFTYVKTTQAMNVAVEWLRVLKIVTFSYVPFTR